MKTITLNVPQGVGDIFWIYQKVEPFFDEINFNILVVHANVVQYRAKKFVELLPKVKKVGFTLVNGDYYARVAALRRPVTDILGGKSVYDYAVNKPLEEGVRLEDIDAGQQVAWDIKFNVPAERVKENKYVLFYTSGNKHDSSWSSDHWYQLLASLVQNGYREHEFVMFGAQYDMPSLTGVGAAIQKHLGVKVSWQIDGPTTDAIRFLRDADLFIGYQSGLNIIADNYNTKQIMVYFNWLDKMKYSWCHKENIKTKFFAYIFQNSPALIAKDFLTNTK